jgi:hypothetical protein
VVAALTGTLAFILLRGRPATCQLHVYGFADDPAVQGLLSTVRQEAPGATVAFHDLSEGDNGGRFSRALAIVNTEANIPILPESVERRTAPPYIHYHNEYRYYGEYTGSLVGTYCGGSLVALVIGGSWYENGFWRQLLGISGQSGGVHVFAPSGAYELSDKKLIAELSLVLGENSFSRGS